jgi:23S rRNA (adenine2503-C2)-methyltransferase
VIAENVIGITFAATIWRRMASLLDFNVATFAEELERLGENPAHASKILRTFYAGEPIDRLPILKSLRLRLATNYAARPAKVLTKHVSVDGTIKLLLGFESGGTTEAVLMPTFREGIAAGCVSSQIGCAMGCDFCASTKNGLERNLSAGEIVEQFLQLRAEALASSRRLKTLVFMGMGEPLHNLDNVIPAIERIAHPDMGALGWRQITVSTVGIVPGIDHLGDSGLNVNLALSLHAPDDATRAKIVPSNRRYPVADIISAAKRYDAQTGRVVNIEYCVLGGVNDSDEQADLLADLLDGFRAHVNLIPYNPIGVGITGVTYVRPSKSRVTTFLNLLRDRGVVAHVRVTRGDDVSAACGQLRQQVLLPQ